MQPGDLRIVPASGTVVSPSARQYVLRITTQDMLDKIRPFFPEAHCRQFQDTVLMTVPMHEHTIAVLKYCGYNILGLDPFYYLYNCPLIEGEWPALPHQLATSAFLTNNPRAYCLNTMRTGKTGSAVVADDYLRCVVGLPGATLIISTVSTMKGVWKRTIETTLPHTLVSVLYSSGGKKGRLKAMNRNSDYFIINYDGIKVMQKELLGMIQEGIITRIIIDELTHYGNEGNDRWVAMNRLLNDKKARIPYCWGLTGSPAGNPLAVYGMVQLITEERMPYMKKSWEQAMYHQWGQMSFQRSEKPEAQHLIKQVMQPAIRFDKKDIMVLPPIVKLIRDCDLSKDQHKLYVDIREELYALTEEGVSITSATASAKAHKLFQIALGSVNPDQDLRDGAEELGPLHINNKPRIDIMQEIIEEASQKVVIFVTYKAAGERTAEQLRERGYTVGVVNGSTSEKKRTELFMDFQHKRDPHILVCHPTTTAFGVELAAADTIIFNGPPREGNFIYQQALERLSSLKQKARQITIAQLGATTEELAAFRAIDKGVSLAEQTADLFTEITKQRLAA